MNVYLIITLHPISLQRSFFHLIYQNLIYISKTQEWLYQKEEKEKAVVRMLSFIYLKMV